jgi:hypothetical protein
MKILTIDVGGTTSRFFSAGKRLPGNLNPGRL